MSLRVHPGIAAFGITAYVPSIYSISFKGKKIKQCTKQSINFSFNEETQTLNYEVISKTSKTIFGSIKLVDLGKDMKEPNDIIDLELLLPKIFTITSKRGDTTDLAPPYISIDDVHNLSDNEMFKGKKFKLIVSQMSFPHFIDPLHVLKTLYQDLLAEDGFIVISNIKFNGIDGEMLINILEWMKQQGYAIAWSPALLHNEKFIDKLGNGVLIIKKTAQTPSQLNFPIEPDQIIKKRLHYRTNKIIAASPLLKDRSSLSFDEAKKMIKKYFSDEHLCLNKSEQALIGRGGDLADLMKKSITDSKRSKRALTLKKEIMEIASSLPRLMQIFSDSRFTDEKNFYPVLKHALGEQGNNLEYFLKKELSKFDLELFIEAIILLARIELDFYMFRELYFSDCQKLGLPKPDFLLWPLTKSNSLLEKLVPILTTSAYTVSEQDDSKPIPKPSSVVTKSSLFPENTSVKNKAGSTQVSNPATFQ